MIIPLNITKLHTLLRPCLVIRTYSNSNFSPDEIQRAKKWVSEYTSSSIPTHEFEITYSRASGAGGQKVNKTSSKATVAMSPEKWLDQQFCYWIPKPILSQISAKKIRYETKSGGVLIQSDNSRNRDVNTAECFSKLLNEIKDVVYFEEEMSEDDKKRWEDIKEKAKEKRLFHKKRQSDKKKSRSKNFDL